MKVIVTIEVSRLSRLKDITGTMCRVPLDVTIEVSRLSRLKAGPVTPILLFKMSLQ